jgi:hypothetical protein
MVRMYEASETDIDKIIAEFLLMIQKDSGKDIFTLRVTDRSDVEINLLIVFTDESILESILKIQYIENKIALRVQGNYI